jgi:3-hydroxyisobutyrate dehydrogenase
LRASNAANGSLIFLVGGDAGALDLARPALQAMSSDIVHVGLAGSGALLKLINNFLCGVQVASLAEAIAMIEASGLDVGRSIGVLGAGAPGSPLVRMVAQRMLDRAYDPNFVVPLMAKDLQYAIAAFAGQGIDLKTAEAARTRFLEAGQAGFSDRDIAAVVEPLRSAATARSSPR